MPRLRDVLSQLATSLLSGSRRRSGEDRSGARPRPRPTPGPGRAEPRRPPGGRDRPAADGDAGRRGPHATVEARRVGTVHTAYNPSTDGDPDPGEIVWTWVPYEENDGRGKDRPVLIVAREDGGTLLAVQLSSRDHSDDHEWVAIGAGAWDGENRPSWVDTDRVLRVHPEGMRREAAALNREQFDVVTAALRSRYGWR